jgi:hypothetical protein
MPGAEATVLVIWETILDTMAGYGSFGTGMVGSFGDEPEAGAASEKAALGIAGRHDGITGAILAVGGEVGADVIVLGTRGRSGVTSPMLGSVSHAVVHHADRPVLGVPAPGLAEQRHHRAEHAQIAVGIT